MKQGQEDFELVKDADDNKGNYIFQNNKLTKGTAIFIAAVLILITIAIIVTGFKF